MADIAISGAVLKKLLAMAKKRDLAFAYCPGGKPQDDVFVLDRKKKPEVIGRAARAEGEGSKLAYGYASLSGKLLTLTCERVLPGAAKRLKRWLRDEKCPLNVKVLDADGNVVEEDIEDLPEDDFLADVEAEADEELGNDPDPEPEGNAEALKALKVRAAALQPAIASAPAAAQKPLAKVFKVALTALKAGDAQAASGALDKLDQALAKLADAPPQPEANAPDADPMLAKLSTVADQLGQKIESVQAVPVAEKLLHVHGVLLGQIEAGDTKKAAATAKALSAAIAKVPPPSAAQDAAPSPDDPNASDDGRAWNTARAQLEPAVLRTLQAGTGDVSKLRAAWGFFNEKGQAGAYADGMRAVPGIQKLIKAAEAAEQSEAEKDIPTDVVPFVKARLGWAKIRNQLMSEMMKLENAILAACQGDAFAGMAQDTKMLFSHLEGLDDRLEQALDAVVQAPDDGKRAAKKIEARSVVQEYMNELGSPFFQDVDSDNGFAPVKVSQTATQALAQVDKLLSRAA